MLPSPNQTPARPRSRRRQAGVLVVVGLAWATTLVALVRREVQGSTSDDVRALVEATGLRRAHASARYSIRMGANEIGSLETSVSGGQREEQLAYVLKGTLRYPQPVDLKGFVLADWDRHPERFVLELTAAGERHRVEGGIDRDGATALFHAKYLPPGDGQARSSEWVLPEAPVLAPGPLPLPEMSWAGGPGESAGLVAGSPREGTITDPLSGEPVSWSVSSEVVRGLMVAGRRRDSLRHDLRYGPAFTASVWVEASGFPLRVELPLGVVIELVEETR